MSHVFLREYLLIHALIAMVGGWDSIVAADGLVLKPQAISIQNTALNHSLSSKA